MDKKALGLEIKAARVRKDMSQDDLAASTGFTIHSIRNWEQGRTQPTALQTGRLASALGVTTDQLIYGTCPV